MASDTPANHCVERVDGLKFQRIADTVTYWAINTFQSVRRRDYVFYMFSPLSKIPNMVTYENWHGFRCLSI